MRLLGEEEQELALGRAAEREHRLGRRDERRRIAVVDGSARYIVRKSRSAGSESRGADRPRARARSPLRAAGGVSGRRRCATSAGATVRARSERADGARQDLDRRRRRASRRSRRARAAPRSADRARRRPAARPAPRPPSARPAAPSSRSEDLEQLGRHLAARLAPELLDGEQLDVPEPLIRIGDDRRQRAEQIGRRAAPAPARRREPLGVEGRAAHHLARQLRLVGARARARVERAELAVGRDEQDARRPCRPTPTASSGLA